MTEINLEPLLDRIERAGEAAAGLLSDGDLEYVKSELRRVGKYSVSRAQGIIDLGLTPAEAAASITALETRLATLEEGIAKATADGKNRQAWQAIKAQLGTALAAAWTSAQPHLVAVAAELMRRALGTG